MQILQKKIFVYTDRDVVVERRAVKASLVNCELWPEFKMVDVPTT